MDEDVSEENENKKLQEIFLEGWRTYEFLEETTIDTNSAEYLKKVKDGMEQFEKVTHIVNQIGMFSSNELLDEVPTESLQYMLLPFFLGKLALKRNEQDRLDTLRIAEIYFKDFLQRCREYDLYESPQDDKEDRNVGNSANAMQQLMQAAIARNNKIAQYKRKKELEEHIKLMREAVKSNSVEDEVKRDFFIKFIKKGIIDACEELESIQLEKGVLEMRKMHMPEHNDQQQQLNDLPSVSHNANPRLHQTRHAAHAHNHQHDHHNHTSHYVPPKPAPLQPFIITRNAAQKAVFGMGYPSLPVLSVGDFYKQRVEEGIFPDEEQVAKMNQAQAIAAAQDPNEKEDQEKAVVEQQEEEDDPVYLARMRRLDEYKDVVRRGDGNRYNRS